MSVGDLSKRSGIFRVSSKSREYKLPLLIYFLVLQSFHFNFDNCYCSGHLRKFTICSAENAFTKKKETVFFGVLIEFSVASL